MSSAVPDEWRISIIDDIAKTSAGGTPSTQKPEFWEDGDIPWMSSGEVHKKRVRFVDQHITQLGFKNSSAKLFPTKTLLIALAGQGKTRGTVAISEMELTTNQSIAGVLIQDSSVDPDFVFHNLDSRYDELRSVSGGSGRAGLNLTIIGEQELLLPPLPEQQKIASILSSVDDVITKTAAQIDKLKGLKTGMMQELLTKGIGHTQFKDSPVGRIPVGWDVQTLQEVATIQTGAAKNSKSVGDLVDVPYLRVANVQDGYLDLSEIKTIGIERARVDRFLLQDEDVLVNEGGDFDKLGRGSIWHNQISPCVHQNHVFVVRTHHGVLLPIFFNYLSGSEHGKKYYLGCAKQTTNLASINSSQLKKFPVLLPSLDEQQSICDILGSIDGKIDAIQRKLVKNQDLKKALMQDLLTGKVRVSVN